MATSKISFLVQSRSSSCKVKAALPLPHPQYNASNLPFSRDLADEMSRRNLRLMTNPSSTNYRMEQKPNNINTSYRIRNYDEHTKFKVQEMYAILESVGDRAEMHKNIGQQRDNWNSLLLNSINKITVTATIMTGLAAASGVGAPLLALKVSSSILYFSATVMLLVMNKIQPSQLAEEQRIASRLFKQLHEEIQDTIACRDPSPEDVKNAMQKILALDKAYPLPLIGAMLNKFPKIVEPAVWWPKEQKSHDELHGEKKRNGWNENLEKEMRAIVEILKRKDTAEYKRLGELAKKVNKILAISGPLFTGIAAIGSAFMGTPVYGSSAATFGMIFGSLATVINTLEHGGQVGMVFEMYRSSAGFFKLLEDNIESSLKEKDFVERENGELLEMKVALQLGRSLEELGDLADHSSLSSCHGQTEEDFASKLF